MTALHDEPRTDGNLLSPVRAGTPAERLTSDEAWLRAMLDAEAALARAQATLGILPHSAAATITRTAEAAKMAPGPIAVAAREHANPVVGLVGCLTRAVAEHDPQAAEYVHRGSTSQDILDTGTMIVARQTLTVIRDDLRRSSAALGELAGRYRDLPAAGRTLALHAVPTTFGLRVAGWRRLVMDAERRLSRVLAEGLPVSLGGAAGTLGGYLEYAAPEQRAEPGEFVSSLVAEFAHESGLCPQVLPWHALRTPVADLTSVLGFTAGALGKIAADVLTLSRSEIGEVAEPGPEGRGASSAMPHKRNPVLATMIRSAALQVPALVSGLNQCLTSEDERSAGAWHAEWSLLRDCLALSGGAAHTLVELSEGIEVHADRVRENLERTGDTVSSERVAAALAPRVGRARARELMTLCSAEAARTRSSLAQVLAKEPEVEEHFTPEQLARLCEAAGFTGAAAALVDGSLEQEAVADGG
ncbi:putative 3-carboxymuconate cycloisomerase (PcaB) [Nocardiopsis kunsanensis]|uniref:3-carboxymuconate cycloisomerase (PcaB) n=1 Tax=Nocardiopsis kunsanensis TaxID=141693 RepID=A0A918X8G2_9ACTN|nr:lyase family protein [Nocardiopsis kunsanensis]GHD17633.1 putative 3-carboxymuconate cycloisomerase (PcaB) [Nocardiopsis kunsanensis]